MSKRLMTICVCGVLVLSTLFVWIGYAALTDELTVTGEVDFAVPEEVVITSIEVASQGSGVTSEQSFIWPTNVDSTVTTTGGGNTVTYKITVKNNSVSTEYSYARIAYDSTLYNNAQYESGAISLKLTTDAAGNTALNATNSKLAPGGQMDIYAAYTFPASTSAEYRTFLNYKFLPYLDADTAGEIAVNNVVSHFETVLNNHEQQIEDLIAANKNDNGLFAFIGALLGAETNYTGNVPGSTDAENTAINEMFTVDGENMLVLETANGTTEVTCMIESKIIDGIEHMILYLTPDTITGSIGWREAYDPDTTVNVYAQVFTKLNNEWSAWGDMNLGQANTMAYKGWTIFGATCDSFAPVTWRSSGQTFEVCEGYTYNGTTYDGLSYTVETGHDIDDVIAETKTDTSAYHAQILGHAEAIYDANKDLYSGEAIDALALAILQAETIETTGADPIASIKQLRLAIQPFLG